MDKALNQVVFVTGGAGFIGSALIRNLIAKTEATVVNIDKLTYAANLSSLASIDQSDRYFLEIADICDGTLIPDLFAKYEPNIVMHLAAESHVDRSIDGPSDFITTNINGTFNLLESALHYWQSLEGDDRDNFRFLHVSTDEVFGSLGPEGLFHEGSRYQPNSPYSASKASSDHLVRAWHETFDLPVMLTNCTNNYGPFQFPEKLIPVVILKCLNRESIPVYGKGENIRDWLFVDDHADALWQVATKGKVGETYCIGGDSEKQNIDLVRDICTVMDNIQPPSDGIPSHSLIEFVVDRPGHDMRYAMDSSKIRRELGWVPSRDYDTGLLETVTWYLENRDWWQAVIDTKYAGQRLGIRSK